VDCTRSSTWKLSELGVLRPLAGVDVGNLTCITVSNWISLSGEMFFSNVKGG
jgi:hypothetical protein